MVFTQPKVKILKLEVRHIISSRISMLPKMTFLTWNSINSPKNPFLLKNYLKSGIYGTGSDNIKIENNPIRKPTSYIDRTRSAGGWPVSYDVFPSCANVVPTHRWPTSDTTVGCRRRANVGCTSVTDVWKFIGRVSVAEVGSTSATDVGHRRWPTYKNFFGMTRMPCWW